MICCCIVAQAQDYEPYNVFVKLKSTRELATYDPKSVSTQMIQSKGNIEGILKKHKVENAVHTFSKKQRSLQTTFTLELTDSTERLKLIEELSNHP